MQQPGRKKGHSSALVLLCISINMGNAPESLRRDCRGPMAKLLQQQITCCPVLHQHCLSWHPCPCLCLRTASFSREVSPNSLPNTWPPQRFRDRKMEGRERSTVWREGSAARAVSAQSLLLYCIYSSYLSLQKKVILIIWKRSDILGIRLGILICLGFF